MNEYDYLVCIDCMDVIANGWENFTNRYPEDYSETNARHEDIDRGLERGNWYLTDYEDVFSTARCDCCGSTFAGYRNGAVLLETE